MKNPDDRRQWYWGSEKAGGWPGSGRDTAQAGDSMHRSGDSSEREDRDRLPGWSGSGDSSVWEGRVRLPGSRTDTSPGNGDSLTTAAGCRGSTPCAHQVIPTRRGFWMMFVAPPTVTQPMLFLTTNMATKLRIRQTEHQQECHQWFK